MDFGIFKTLQQEWPAVTAAPWSFVIIASIAVAAGFFVASLYYGGSLATLRERVQLYQDRLQGLSPDQARARIDALEASVAKLGPRRLTPEQRETLSKSLMSFRASTIEIFHDMSVADSAAYANEFRNIFQRLTWKVASPAGMGFGMAPPSGLGVNVNDPKHMTEVETAVVDGLQKASIRHDVLHGKLTTADAEIVVTSALH